MNSLYRTTQPNTAVPAPIIPFMLYQTTTWAYRTMDGQPEGAFINEDTSHPIIQPYLYIALRATGTTSLWQDMPSLTEWALYIKLLFRYWYHPNTLLIQNSIILI